MLFVTVLMFLVVMTMADVEVRDHCYRTRFTFYGAVTYAEYVLVAPDKYAAVKWFLQDNSDDALVSVQCCKRDDDGWTAEHTMFNRLICAGSVSKFITACRDYVESYFYQTEPAEDALLAAMVIDDAV